MRILRLLPYLTHIQEHNGVSLSAALRCVCGGTVFAVSHTGKQTKGFLAPLILPRNRQLCVTAHCFACGETIRLYDSRIDGCDPREAEEMTEIPLAMKQGNEWQIKVRLNYFPERLRTDTGEYSNRFENLLADIHEPEPTAKAYTLLEI